MHGFSINRHRRVDLPGPSIDTTLQIMQVGEALTLQKCDDLQTSHPVMTNNDRGKRPVQFVRGDWNLPHGYVFTAVDFGQLPFPRLAHIEQARARIRRFGQRRFELLDGKFTHARRSKREARWLGGVNQRRDDRFE